ncbi:hypothetical protein T35B1_04868 [Salinisphaera shabanensis T35B1]|uniref:hypothetical protein n=1 Tax=Salinisphaera shabanensis TaxID=180542 RepID=UPI00333F5A57
MSRSEFIITYDGPALKNSEMDARDLAPALIAISDLVDRANEIVNHERATSRVIVRASFRSGCFGIDMGIVQSTGQWALDLLKSDAVVAAATLGALIGLGSSVATGLIYVLKKIRGRPIRKVVSLDNDRIQIVVDDERIETEMRVLELLRDPAVRKAIQRVVYEPLERDGIDEFAAQSSPDSKPVIVSKEERHAFKAPPDPENEEIEETISEEPLQLVSVAFRDENKWRVSDGSSTFYAAMNDPEFNREVELGNARFSSNDLLYVRLLRRRYLDGQGNLKTDVEILKVLDHKKGERQYNLGLDDDRIL